MTLSIANSIFLTPLIYQVIYGKYTKNSTKQMENGSVLPRWLSFEMDSMRHMTSLSLKRL